MFLDIFGTSTAQSIERKRREGHWLGSRKSRIRKKEAWSAFVGERNLEEIVEDMNETWIDPGYRIRIELIARVRAEPKDD